MKIYTIDRWRNLGVDENIVFCTTKELAEKEIIRLKKEDENFCDKTEKNIREKTKDPFYICSFRGEYRYKIREIELKEEKEDKYFSLKEDELVFLKQIYRNLKHLHHLYTNSILKNIDKAFHTEISINNTHSEIERIEKEVGVL